MEIIVIQNQNLTKTVTSIWQVEQVYIAQAAELEFWVLNILWNIFCIIWKCLWVFQVFNWLLVLNQHKYYQNKLIGIIDLTFSYRMNLHKHDGFGETLHHKQKKFGTWENWKPGHIYDIERQVDLYF